MGTPNTDCRRFAEQADDWLDDRLDAAAQASMQRHLDNCPGCSRGYRQAAALRAALRGLAAPAMRGGFAESALAQATRSPARPTSAFGRAALGLALAAGLALALGVGLVWRSARLDPARTVFLTEKQPESVRLVFNAARALPGTTISLRLPENVRIVGYGDRRELTWKTDLRQGGNLLRLPLVAYGPAEGELVARLSNGSSSRTFKLRIKLRGAGAAGDSPSRVAYIS